MRYLIALALAGCAGKQHLVEPDPIVITAKVDKPAPKKPPKRVEVKEDRIDVSETIQFDFSSSRISDDSHALLDEIYEAIDKHPEIKQLRVEGHTDNTGDAPHNLRLSKKRAAAVVKYLVDKGIDAGRLIPAGFGQTKPIGSNDTEEGRAQNRRVAFVILDRGDGKKKKPDAEPADDGGGDE